MLLAVISGIGVAAYHPEAARLINFEEGSKKNTAMSFFGVGGTIGFAIGPFLITTSLLQWGLKGTIILLPAFCMFNNTFISLFLMFPIGLILYASYSPSIVLGQNYLPNRLGLSSGITLGVAISIGGAVTPVIGKIADIYGIWVGICTIAFLPILIFWVAIRLPNPKSDNEKQHENCTKS